MSHHEEGRTTNPRASTGSPAPRPLDKAATHIPGLDDILEGGLPRGRTTVVRGGAGSGKTLLGLEFLYRGALAGEPGIFAGFEEPAEQLRMNAATLGWDLPALERQGRLFLLEGYIGSDAVISGEFSLKGLLAAVAGKAREMGASRAVIDALEVLLRLYDSPKRVRAELHALNDWLHATGMTTLMTVRLPRQGAGSAFEEFFDSMADCLIHMDARISEQIATRRLRVLKYRGSGFGGNEYPYVITPTGLHMAPISTVGLRHKPLGERIPTGLERLDDLLAGGYRRASCVLVAGLPGTGKTLLATTFARAACERGEKVLYVGFEESEEALMGNMRSAGVELEPHSDAQRLRFLTAMPESMGAEEHFVRLMQTLEAFEPGHVVVDAISACQRMGGMQAAFEYLARVLNACKERNMTVLLLNQTSGAEDFLEISGNGISSMVDTVIFLAYVEEEGETNRTVQVLKSRGSAHSNRKHRYVITDRGMEILGVYKGEERTKEYVR